MHGLPVLYDGLPIWSPALRVEQGLDAQSQEVHHVCSTPGKRAQACLHRSVSGAGRGFGEREDLLREAENRLRQEPTKYLQYIYGKQEVGGTSVLYLSAVSFEGLGLPNNLPHDALSMYTYRVLSEIPSLVTLGGALLGGIWWITKRREEVANAGKVEGKRK